MLTVVACLWSDPARRRDYTFNPGHVGILRNMVARNLTLPHEFVCITDSQETATRLHNEQMRCVPLDPTTHVPGTVFARLMLRRPDIAGILGRRIMSLDLDIVITANIDHIAGRLEDNVLWHNPNYEPGGRRAFYQTSVQLFDAGARSFLYTDFDPKMTPTWINRRFGGAEQAWFSERLGWDEAYWDEKDGIYGAGRLFEGGWDKGVRAELPENACIVSFPGNRLPDQPDVMAKCGWIKDHYR
jgi:hypothetical protein